MKSLIIIKLGGSVITYKESKTPKVRITEILRLAVEVAQLVKSEKYRIIIVHGAGSFGHPIAKKYSLHKGMKTAEQRLAYSQALQNMIKLNGIITESLLTKSIPVVGLAPQDFVVQKEGNFKGFDFQIIENYLQRGLVPVLFGDGVLDDKWGCSILSGDTIVSYLANKLKAKEVVFLSDIDGIFDEDPKINPQAKLIPEVNSRNLNNVLRILQNKDSSRTNITGEMYGKVLAIKKELRNKNIYIANGFKQGILTKILAGEKVGTKIHFT